MADETETTFAHNLQFILDPESRKTPNDMFPTETFQEPWKEIGRSEDAVLLRLYNWHMGYLSCLKGAKSHGNVGDPYNFKLKTPLLLDLIRIHIKDIFGVWVEENQEIHLFKADTGGEFIVGVK